MPLCWAEVGIMEFNLWVPPCTTKVPSSGSSISLVTWHFFLLRAYGSKIGGMQGHNNWEWKMWGWTINLRTRFRLIVAPCLFQERSNTPWSGYCMNLTKRRRSWKVPTAGSVLSSASAMLSDLPLHLVVMVLRYFAPPHKSRRSSKLRLFAETTAATMRCLCPSTHLKKICPLITTWPGNNNAK